MNRVSWVSAMVLLVCGCGRSDASGNAWPSAGDSLAAAMLDSLQVATIDLRLSDDSNEAKQQLWGTFANRGLAMRYSRIAIPGDVSAWWVFRERLVEAAKTEGRNADSLARALDEIAKQEERLIAEGQIYPFGAFIAKQRGERVWVIPCLWESGTSYDSEGQPRPVKASHIRIWAFLVESGRQVGYVTCK